MTKNLMRDEVRALAEIPGSNTMAGLINSAIQDAIDAITKLARYDELYTVEDVVVIAANGRVTLPSGVQHLDKDHIYYYRDNDVDQRIRLYPFSRTRAISTGMPKQWRLFSVDFGTLTRMIEITPYGEIDTTADRLVINYWRRYVWLESVEFPIPSMEETIKLKAAARVAKQANSRLAQRLTIQARDAYASLRAGSY